LSPAPLLALHPPHPHIVMLSAARHPLHAPAHSPHTVHHPILAPREFNRTREPPWWQNLIHNIGFDSRHVATQRTIAAAALPLRFPTRCRCRQSRASAKLPALPPSRPPLPRCRRCRRLSRAATTELLLPLLLPRYHRRQRQALAKLLLPPPSWPLPLSPSFSL
jgi:hypothetical protein